MTPLRGVRAFRVDGLGRLVGARLHHWSPGEQRAECLVTGASVDDVASGRHDPSDCTCGFYAYYDGVSDFAFRVDGTLPGLVHGVVEGYGLVSVGTRGFRSTRARLVAVALPSEGGDPREDPTSSAGATRAVWWRRSRRVATLRGTALAYVTAVLSLATAGIVALDLLTPVELAVGWGVLVFLALAVTGHTLATLVATHPVVSRRLPRPLADRGLPLGAVEKVRRNYPGVVVLPTLAALLAAYPPSEPPEDAPETVAGPSHEHDPDLRSRP